MPCGTASLHGMAACSVCSPPGAPWDRRCFRHWPVTGPSGPGVLPASLAANAGHAVDGHPEPRVHEEGPWPAMWGPETPHARLREERGK